MTAGVVQLESEARPRRSPFEWFTRKRSLVAARSKLRARSVREDEFARRARLALEIAERLFDPVEPPIAGSTAAIVAELYKQAAYFALCALQHGATTPPAAEVWASLSEEQLTWALPTVEERAQVRETFVDSTFVSLAEGSADEQRETALRARRFAFAMVELMEGDQLLVKRLQFERLLRIGTLVALLCGAALGGNYWYQNHRFGPDLAAGKPWKASSEWAKCDPVVERCGGLNTKIFFHTKEDDPPWVEFDLGAPRKFSRVFVKNRRDDAPDRAIPLIIEVSNDQKKYKKVATQKLSFRDWMAEFPQQTARYVRVSVGRRSYLHLEKVMIYE